MGLATVRDGVIGLESQRPPSAAEPLGGLGSLVRKPVTGLRHPMRTCRVQRDSIRIQWTLDIGHWTLDIGYWTFGQANS